MSGQATSSLTSETEKDDCKGARGGILRSLRLPDCTFEPTIRVDLTQAGWVVWRGAVWCRRVAIRRSVDEDDEDEDEDAELQV